MFQAKLEQYNGPLDKLLELIEEQKLEITSLSLSQVTLDFLDYLKKEGSSVKPEILSDFLVVASRLVLIKSKTLIPDLELKEDEERDIHDLELRLKLYRTFSVRSGGKALEIVRLWNKAHVMIGRPLLAGLVETKQFYPGENLTAETLHGAVLRIMSELKAILPETRTIRQSLVSLEEKIQELLLRCKEAQEQKFSAVLKDKPRGEVIVLFLALLHLLKAKSISVRQDDVFSDIIVKRTNA